MAIEEWKWQAVPQATPWNPQAWRLLNQRLAQLERMLSGIRGVTVEQLVNPSGETEPLVARIRALDLDNATTTAVVRFRGGEPGQLLVVRALDDVTTVTHSPILRLTGNADWVTIEGETRLFWTPDGFVWYEVSRDISAADEGWILTNAGLPLTTNDGDYLATGG